MVWTDQQVDEVLELILPLDSLLLYQRACVKISKERGTHEADPVGRLDGDPVNRLLWGLAVCARQYTPQNRQRRDRLLFTWVERKIVAWAFEGNAKASLAPPTVEHVAKILQRSPQEVRVIAEKYYGQGIPGFGL